jgi:hypothetical protein
MPNLRPLAVIGLASAVAAIAPGAFKFEGIPRLARPAVYSILVRPETVWFCAVSPIDSQRVKYGYVRSTREWKAGSDMRGCPEPPKPRIYFDSIPPISLAAGLRAEIAWAPRDSEGVPRGRSHLRLLDSARSLRLDLRPVVLPERISDLLKSSGGSVVDDTTSISIGGTATNDSLAWIGLAGGFPEGEGALGGIYRIDRRSGAWSYIVDTTLSWHAVTGLAQTRDWLWVGTEQPAEYGAFGRAGLLRLDLRTGQWRGFRADNSPLPDALIVRLAGDEDLIAIATERGLAVAELRASPAPREIERWSVQHLVPTFSGDSLVYRLASAQDSLSEDAEAPYIFVQTYAKRGQERSVFEQIRKVPLAVIKNANDGVFEGGRGLADPTFGPILVAMLSSRSEAQRLAAEAIRRLGRRTPADVRASARETFASYDTARRQGGYGDNRQYLATALRSFGDSTAIRWARRILDRSQPGIGPRTEADSRRREMTSAIEILAEARDPRGLSLIIATPAVDGDLFMHLLHALARYDSPRAWLAADRLIEARSRDANADASAYLALELTRKATPTAMDNASIRRKVLASIRDGLRQDRGDRRWDAVLAIERLRLAALTPELIEHLSDRNGPGGAAYSALVSLYGRADAPVYRDIPPADAIDWWKAVVKRKPPVVPRAQGEKALREWSRRRVQLIKPPG